MPSQIPVLAEQVMSRAQAESVLDDHTREQIDHWRAKYPPERRRSAMIAALTAAQHQNGGSLSRELLDAVAAYLDLPPIYVYEAASFYSMFELEPVGRHSISVCTNISCMLCGADDILQYLQDKLGIKPGQSTADGRFYIKVEEECLAACCGAPMMMVDHVYYENLTPAKVDEILAGLE